jgi:hypothetical protein
MDGNSNCGARSRTIGSSASASSSPSLVDHNMPPINNENVECVDSGPTTIIGTQIPSPSLSPNTKKI